MNGTGPRKRIARAAAFAAALLVGEGRGADALGADSVALVPLLAESAAAEESTGTLEEVVVTARRRSEDLQRVPISIANLSADNLEIRGLSDVAALDHSIVNFSPAPYNFFGTEQASFRIRGLPSVGVYVDGIAYQEKFGFFYDLIEMDRVEVLRGPQGTLFGKNTLGGAIQYVTTQPADEFGARFSTTVGDYRRLSVSGAADMPLSSTLLTKVTVAKVTRDGYLPSVSVNNDYGSQDDLVARLDVLWKPTDDFKARLIVEENDIGTNGNPSTIWQLSPACVLPQPNLTCLYNGAGLKVNQRWVFGPTQQWLTAGNYEGPEFYTDSTNYKALLNYKINADWGLAELAGYRTVHSQSFEDFTSIPYRMFEGENTNRIEEWTSETQLLFHGERFTGTTGLYDYSDHRRWRRNNWFGNELKSDVDPADNAAANAYLTSLLVAAGAIPPSVHLRLSAFIPDVDDLDVYDIHGVAGFTEWTFKATDMLSLTAGVRYNRDSDTVTAFVPNQPIPVICCVPSVSVESTGSGPLGPVVHGVYTNWAPRLSLQYQWTPAVMTYATYAEGFNQGGGTQVASGVQAYSPETLKNYEVGLRSALFDNTLRFNASVFYSRYSNVQVTEDIDFNNVIVNGGKGRVKGLEAEGQWLASRSFSINYAFGYLQSGYSDYAASSGIIAGTPFPYAPKYSADAGLQYDMPLPTAANLTLRADEGWTSWVNTASDSSSVYIPSYGLLGARIVYHPTGGNWNVQLSGSNLLDKYYRLTGYNIVALGLNTGTVGIPRMWELALNFKIR
jgi:iron complex outermembrane receptor protein